MDTDGMLGYIMKYVREIRIRREPQPEDQTIPRHDGPFAGIETAGPVPDFDPELAGTISVELIISGGANSNGFNAPTVEEGVGLAYEWVRSQMKERGRS